MFVMKRVYVLLADVKLMVPGPRSVMPSLVNSRLSNKIINLLTQ